MPQSYENAPPCPFCGGTDLLVGLWSVDEGEIDSLECKNCHGSAPTDVWMELDKFQAKDHDQRIQQSGVAI